MDWMKVKQAGLPRWAWVSLFSGAVLVGLYLRHKSKEAAEPEEVEEEPTVSEDSLASYNESESAGGLAAAGLIGPAQGQVVPVEAPYIPQGFVDIFGDQAETTQALIGALAEREPGERVEVIHEKEGIGEPQGLTGGGPTKKKPHHKPPPTQHKPSGKKPPKHKKPPRRRMGVGPGHPAR